MNEWTYRTWCNVTLVESITEPIWDTKWPFGRLTKALIGVEGEVKRDKEQIIWFVAPLSTIQFCEKRELRQCIVVEQVDQKERKYIPC